MKVYARPVKMILVVDEKGVSTPVKFQMYDDNKELLTVKVDQVVLRDEEKLAGNRMLLFRCQSFIDSSLKVYELKYEVSTMKWYLWKI